VIRPSARKVGWRLSLAALAAVLVLGGCGSSSDLGRQLPIIPVDKALAPAEFTKEHWPSEGWSLYSTVVVPLSRGDHKRRSWISGDDQSGLEQAIQRLANVSDARSVYRREDPKSYDEDYPLRIDASDQYRSVSANESHVYCLGSKGSKDACSVWTYWAMYGQYILRLDYVAGLTPSTSDTFVLQPGISLRRFLEYVQAFDRQVGDVLQSARSTPSAAPS
jgi:hypothetical protein